VRGTPWSEKNSTDSAKTAGKLVSEQKSSFTEIYMAGPKVFQSEIDISWLNDFLKCKISQQKSLRVIFRRIGCGDKLELMIYLLHEVMLSQNLPFPSSPSVDDELSMSTVEQQQMDIEEYTLEFGGMQYICSDISQQSVRISDWRSHANFGGMREICICVVLAQVMTEIKKRRRRGGVRFPVL
jgi:hypothetical protein